MEPPSFNRAQLAHLASKFPGLSFGDDQLSKANKDSTTTTATQTIRIYVPPNSEERVISYKEMLQQEQDKLQAQQPVTCQSFADDDVSPPLAGSILTTGGGVLNGTVKLRHQMSEEDAWSSDDGEGADTEEAPTTKSGNYDYYQLDDPFIDDSELNLDANVGLVKPKQDGFFVCFGQLETVPVVTEYKEQDRPNWRPKPAVKGKDAAKNRSRGTTASATWKNKPTVSDTDMEGKGNTEETAEKRQVEKKTNRPRRKKSLTEDCSTTGDAVSQARSPSSKPKGSTGNPIRNEEIGGDVVEATVAIPATTISSKKSKCVAPGSSKKEKSKIPTTNSNASRANVPSLTDAEMEDFSTERRMQDNNVAESPSKQPEKLKGKKAKKVDATDVDTTGPSVSSSNHQSTPHGKAMKPRKKRLKKKEADTKGSSVAATDQKQSEDSKVKSKDTTVTTGTPEVTSSVSTAAVPITAESSARRDPLCVDDTPRRTVGTTVPAPSHSITPVITTVNDASMKTDLSLEVTEIVESLRTAAATEAFENKTKFPARLRNIFLQAGRVHLRETGGNLSDLLVNRLHEIMPYNRVTIKKLLLRHLLPERQQDRERRHLQLIEEFKAILEDTLATQRKELEGNNATCKETSTIEALNVANKLSASGSTTEISANTESPVDDTTTDKPKTPTVNGADWKFKFNFALREKLYDVVKSALDICNAANELNELLKKPERQTEHAARASIYAQLAALWPQGWITTSAIGVQFSGVKHRKEVSSKKTTGPKLIGGDGSPSKQRVKKETSAVNENAMVEGRSHSKSETVIARKRKPRTVSEAPQQHRRKKKSMLTEPNEIQTPMHGKTARAVQVSKKQ